MNSRFTAILVITLAIPVAGAADDAEQQLLAPSPLTDDAFGKAVAIGGSRILVGANRQDDMGNNAGLVFQYDDSSVLGDWSMVPSLDTIAATDPDPNDHFGWAVAISNDGLVKVSGAEGWSYDNRGAAYIYSETASRRVEGSAQAEYFGRSVAISGDGTLAAVGSPVLGAGAVHLYLDSSVGQDWTTEPDHIQLVSSVPDLLSNFGASIAVDLDGSTVIAGAPAYATGTSSGAAFLYIDTSLAGDWSEIPLEIVLTASTITNDAHLGFSVAISDDGSTVVVGAPDEDEPGKPNCGAVYIFQDLSASGDWSSWSDIRLLDPNAGGADNLGMAVAMDASGATVAAGAPGDNDPADSGSVSIFQDLTPGHDWGVTAHSKTTAPFAAESDEFGASVALDRSATTLVVGSHLDDGGATDAGAAYIFKRNNSDVLFADGFESGVWRWDTTVGYDGPGVPAITTIACGNVIPGDGTLDCSLDFIDDNAGVDWIQFDVLWDDCGMCFNANAWDPNDYEPGIDLLTTGTINYHYWCTCGDSQDVTGAWAISLADSQGNYSLPVSHTVTCDCDGVKSGQAGSESRIHIGLSAAPGPQHGLH